MQREKERRLRSYHSYSNPFPDDFSQIVHGSSFDDCPDYSTMGDYIPDDTQFFDIPPQKEKHSEEPKKENWRTAYLYPKKKSRKAG